MAHQLEQTSNQPSTDALGGPGDRPRVRLRWPVLALLALGGVVELLLLAAWQRNGCWNFSDGVYAQSARELLHGALPYRDFAASQPPPVYLAGTLLLAVHDGLASLRAGLGAVDLLTAALVGVCVWRLTESRWTAVGAAAVAQLLPISLHEHAQLTPETLAAPLLLGGALLCADDRRRSTAGGALLALAAACKLAFLLPALAIAWCSASRSKTARAFAATGVVVAVASTAAFGSGVWREAIQAQTQVGFAPLSYAGGLLAQGAWSELALVVLAGLALVLGSAELGSVEREAPRARPLVRTLSAAAGAGLLLGLTVLKRGSYINVLTVAEPALLSLATYGAVRCWRLGRRWRVLTVALGCLLTLQSLSLLTSPDDPWAAKRPGAQSGLSWTSSPTQVDRDVARAHRCPGDVAYSGTPYVAFLAKRRMPGGQPDVFMLRYARADSRFASLAANDRARCP